MKFEDLLNEKITPRDVGKMQKELDHYLEVLEYSIPNMLDELNILLDAAHDSGITKEMNRKQLYNFSNVKTDAHFMKKKVADLKRSFKLLANGFKKIDL